jgi:hypothetical protein
MTFSKTVKLYRVLTAFMLSVVMLSVMASLKSSIKHNFCNIKKLLNCKIDIEIWCCH